MSLAEIQEIKTEYEKLTEIERKTAVFSFYICCSSTYESGIFQSWFPTNKIKFEEYLVSNYSKIENPFI